LVHLLSAQKRGHPLKDRSSEKHLFLWKNGCFFPWNKIIVARYRFRPIPHPLFLFYRLFVSTCWSATVTHRDQGDCALGSMPKTRLLVHLDPRASVPWARVYILYNQRAFITAGRAWKIKVSGWLFYA
jgi:hypothetical protein